MRVSKYTKNLFFEKVQEFKEKNAHLKCLSDSESHIVLTLTEKYLKNDNGTYTPPSFNAYKIEGNHISFIIGEGSDGQSIKKRVRFDALKNSRTISFSKKEMSIDEIPLAYYVLLSPFVEGSPNCRAGQGIFEIYDNESRQSVANNEAFDFAEFMGTLRELKKDEGKLTQVATILGCNNTLGIEAKVSYIITASRKSTENREYILQLMNNDEAEIKALAIWNMAKSRGIITQKGNKTTALIDGEEVFIVMSNKESTILEKLQKDKGALATMLEKECNSIKE